MLNMFDYLGPVVVMHPNNRELFETALSLCDRDSPAAALEGVRVEFSKLIPEFEEVEEWSPPAGGRFVDYDYGDESWMRPLRIGVTVRREMVVFLKQHYRGEESEMKFIGFNALTNPILRPRFPSYTSDDLKFDPSYIPLKGV